MINILDCIGMEEKQAIDLLVKNGWHWRVTSRDGKPFIRTADYRPDRVNLEIKSGKITSIKVG